MDSADKSVVTNTFVCLHLGFRHYVGRRFGNEISHLWSQAHKGDIIAFNFITE